MAGYGLGGYGQTPYGGTASPPAAPAGVYQGIVSGSVTATTTGVVLPAEPISPAAGLLGLMTLVNTGAVPVIMSGPASGPFLLPPGRSVVLAVPPGRFAVSTSSGSAPLSYLYAGH